MTIYQGWDLTETVKILCLDKLIKNSLFIPLARPFVCPSPVLGRGHREGLGEGLGERASPHL